VSLKVSEGAFLALAPNGAIRALVGGRSYAKSQFNRVTQARRQPGSAFKPFVYLAGLEVGLSPDKKLSDKPLKYGKWEPKNYNEKYLGTLTLSEALAVSSNSIAVQVAEKAGVNKTISVARRLGVSSPMRADLSIALGSSEVSLLDLTTCYVPFANGGKGVWAHGIKEINDSEGNLLYRRSGSGVGQVVAEKHVRQMNKMLSGVITRGTGKKARINRPVAGKTGTSQEFRDAWFVPVFPATGLFIRAFLPVPRVMTPDNILFIWRTCFSATTCPTPDPLRRYKRLPSESFISLIP
jgi:penicillin-binding protein 1A